MRKKLPIGIENFEKICTQDFYYVDKTKLIKELIDNWGEVNLFTRPRRFGKSLNMSMFKAFFEYGCNQDLFEGLAIAQEKEICERYSGKFPVISISLKGVNGNTYQEALGMIRTVIGTEALRFYFLLESNELREEEKELYRGIIQNKEGSFNLSNEVLMNSLWTLSILLYKHYHQKVIILIDEYDVPLDKAQQYGYYNLMIVLIRNLFGQALKTNDSLYFAVLTGCLRISKESIFTGLNNLKVLSITNVQFDEYFGFTDDEVQELLKYYGLEDSYETVKKWYDGYHFGKVDVYCPWDVINYVDRLRIDSNEEPQAFWLNTSENNILRTFLQRATKSTMREIEQLINGETVRKKIKEELTYRELYDEMDNLWSVLFTTGYLTKCGKAVNGVFSLIIPNFEVKQIFINQIQKWFEEKTHQDTPKLDAFCMNFEKMAVEDIERQLNVYLSQTIGIHDYSIRKELKENYYHGLLVGLLKHREDWMIASNAEAGEGYSDILIEDDEKNIGIIIEVKCPNDGNLDLACEEALGQIETNKYELKPLNDGMEKIIKYGIACHKKHCKVVLGK